MFKDGSEYAENHCFSEHASLMTVIGIKDKVILLAVNCYFVISESE